MRRYFYEAPKRRPIGRYEFMLKILTREPKYRCEVKGITGHCPTNATKVVDQEIPTLRERCYGAHYHHFMDAMRYYIQSPHAKGLEFKKYH